VETLVLFDVDAQLRDACLAHGRKVVLVLPGERFAERGDGVYEVNPLIQGDFERLLRSLEAQRLAIAKLCYAWPACVVPDDAQALDAGLQRGVRAFFLLCQSLLEARRLWKKLQLVYLYATEANASQPHNAAIAGFVSSLRLEMPQ